MYGSVRGAAGNGGPYRDPRAARKKRGGEVDTEGHGLDISWIPKETARRKGRKREVHALSTAGGPRPENAGDVHPGPNVSKFVDAIENK